MVDRELLRQMMAASVSPLGLACRAPGVVGKSLDRVQVATKILPSLSVVISPR